MAQTTTYTNEMETQMPASPKRLARIAGVLYLLNAIIAGFAYGFVEIKMYTAGNAATTAGNVVANSGLVRLACRRRPDPGDNLGLPWNDSLPAAQAREQECGDGNGRPRRNRGRHRMPQRGFRV